jgi:hypothetical protein
MVGNPLDEPEVSDKLGLCFLEVHNFLLMESLFEPVPVKRLRRFWGLFWPLFDSFRGGSISRSILPPRKELKSGSKEPQNRQKLFTGTGSSDKMP